jgi:hypothetical protein
MVNPKGKKTISILVPETYPFKGKDLKKEINNLFQHVWDNNPEALESYPEFEKVKEMLGKW